MTLRGVFPGMASRLLSTACSLRRVLFTSAALGVCFLSPAKAGLLDGDSFYLEIGGIVVVEAENYHSRLGASGGDQWLVVGTGGEATAAGSFSNIRNNQFVQALPDGGSTGGGPTLPNSISYRMSITTPGTYRLYLRWDGVNTDASTQGSSDSIYVDIVEFKDGVGGVADHYELGHTIDGDFNTSAWDSTGQAEANVAGPADNPITWNITTPGIYTLRISAREDGAAVDAFAFQLNSLAAPTGDGPAASAVVPEPGSSLLLAAGIGACAFLRRRR